MQFSKISIGLLNVIKSYYITYLEVDDQTAWPNFFLVYLHYHLGSTKLTIFQIKHLEVCKENNYMLQ